MAVLEPNLASSPNAASFEGTATAMGLVTRQQFALIHIKKQHLSPEGHSLFFIFLRLMESKTCFENVQLANS